MFKPRNKFPQEFHEVEIPLTDLVTEFIDLGSFEEETSDANPFEEPENGFRKVVPTGIDRHWENRMKASAIKTTRNRKANKLAKKARRKR